MKMKIFKGGDVRVLETKINEWLQSEGIGLIHHVTPTRITSTQRSSRSGGASREWGTLRSPMPQVRRTYEVRPRKDHCGVDLISDALPFGRLWYDEPGAASNAVDYAKFFSRSRQTVIRVYDAAGTLIETHEHAGDFKGW